MPPVFAPCAMIGAPNAEADCASPAIGHRPAAKKLSVGRRPSALSVAGSAVNQVGGSTIAVSRSGYAPVMMLSSPPTLSQ